MNSRRRALWSKWQADAQRPVLRRRRRQVGGQHHRPCHQQPQCLWHRHVTWRRPRRRSPQRLRSGWRRAPSRARKCDLTLDRKCDQNLGPLATPCRSRRLLRFRPLHRLGLRHGLLPPRHRHGLNQRRRPDRPSAVQLRTRGRPRQRVLLFSLPGLAAWPHLRAAAQHRQGFVLPQCHQQRQVWRQFRRLLQGRRRRR